MSAELQQEIQEWSIAPLEALIPLRRTIHYTFLQNQKRMYPFWNNKSNHTTFTEEDFQNYPSLREAYTEEQQSMARWEAYKAEITKRLKQFSFMQILENWKMAFEQPEPSYDIISFWKEAVQQQLRFNLSHQAFFKFYADQNWGELSNYNIPRMLHEIQAWKTWCQEHPHMDQIDEWDPCDITEKEDQLQTALHNIQTQWKQQRSLAILLATKSRLGNESWLHHLDPELLQHIAEEEEKQQALDEIEPFTRGLW